MLAVIYTTDDGWKQVRLVPKWASTQDYGKGVLLGPPDLLDLLQVGLTRDQIREINNLLAEAKIVDYESLKGKGGILNSIIQSVVPPEQWSVVRRYIVHIYQRDFYPEQFGGLENG